MSSKTIFSEAKYILISEIKKEISGKYSMLSVILYGFTLSYFIYFLLQSQGALQELETKNWNVIFWILVIFSIINVLLTHFSQDGKGHYLYYYTLFSPRGFILGKMSFYVVYNFIVTILLFIVFSLWLNNPVVNYPMFLLVLLLGSLSFSILFTITTSLAHFQKNRAVLSTVLGLPLSIPLVVLVARLCRESFFSIPSDNFINNLLILLGFNLLMVVLSLVLYPYIWTE